MSLLGSLQLGQTCRLPGTHPAGGCWRRVRFVQPHRGGPGPFGGFAVAENNVDECNMSETERNQRIREGHYEDLLVKRQASKTDDGQESIASVLPKWDTAVTADVAIVGCGPAGLSLSSHLAQRGLKVALVGSDSHFVNNYGVWYDEFEALGLEHTMNKVWDGAISYFGENEEVKVGRKYGRVCRRSLRSHLLNECKKFGVGYLDGLVSDFEVSQCQTVTVLHCANDVDVKARLVTLASGAASGKFLKYEGDAPAVGSQTAYGIEAEVEGYEDKFPMDSMVFMDYRRHHTGLWDSTAHKLENGEHPNADHHLSGAGDEVPSFLYTMPLENGRVFLEETCLVAKPALPFAVLKRRLERRLRAMGIKVKKVYEEEWSYIPVGGPLPLGNQPITAFGAAANLIHPATGYSIARSLRVASELADAIVASLENNKTVLSASQDVWEALWPAEMRRRAAFHIFGMELLAQIRLEGLCQFFLTFFKLPDRMWHGFMASTLSSAELLGFALLTFFLAPPYIKARLTSHILDDSGFYLFASYIGQSEAQNLQVEQEVEEGGLPSLNV